MTENSGDQAQTVLTLSALFHPLLLLAAGVSMADRFQPRNHAVLQSPAVCSMSLPLVGHRRVSSNPQTPARLKDEANFETVKLASQRETEAELQETKTGGGARRTAMGMHPPQSIWA